MNSWQLLQEKNRKLKRGKEKIQKKEEKIMGLSRKRSIKKSNK